MLPVLDRALGSIYGHLCGDALGVPYEGVHPDDLPSEITWRGFGTHDQPPGTWSDDGALMLCTVASIVKRAGLDFEDIGRRFVRWADWGYMAAGRRVFDIGITTRNAIARLRRKTPALDAGLAEKRDNGNGSLMRILPIALWSAFESAERLVECCHMGSRLTHAHPRSQVCCALYGLIVSTISRKGRSDEAFDCACQALARMYRSSPCFSEHVAELEVVRSFSPPTGRGYVVDCLQSSLMAYQESRDYTDAVTRAVRFGRDTDTTAAVTGGLAGLTYGIDRINAEWIRSLRLGCLQRRLIRAYAEAVCKRASCSTSTIRQ